MILPPFLKKGDTIGIISSAGIVSPDEIQYASNKLKENGYEVVVGQTIGKKHNTMAGDDEFRLRELQHFLDDDQISAILFARGGYGTVRLVDRIDFKKFIKYPKWLIGFSDLTTLQNHVLANYEIATLHAPMAKTLRDNRSCGLFFEAISGNLSSYKIKSHQDNITGNAKGILTGGNLSILYNLTGSNSSVDYKGKILFLEDTGEYLYHLDRMLWGLARSNGFSGLKGLIAGNFTGMKTGKNSFGKTAKEIILEHFGKFDYPVVLNFPAGHQKENFPLFIGRNVSLSVDKITTNIRFL